MIATIQTKVSIRTRPIGRVMQRRNGPPDKANHVSIRTRPIGRVMPRPKCSTLTAQSFQSAPGQLAG
ncbi:hypothetical protein SFMTTN_2962 [Sulfuriferula multivorans]|uniref:Uncharacterized protein n=1 Tax=Sulfuriferula multivorans TaxID=1559896 RepID=A0A401JYV0_9PROT|nr:hypothetical protein SFMTTN_2962 [Sulfuriferula multivorans]